MVKAWEAIRVYTMRPAREWHDDDGTVLWWHLPVNEPPCIGAGPGAGERHCDGTPTTCARLLDEGWLTHWSPLPNPADMRTTDGTRIHD